MQNIYQKNMILWQSASKNIFKNTKLIDGFTFTL